MLYLSSKFVYCFDYFCLLREGYTQRGTLWDFSSTGTHALARTWQRWREFRLRMEWDFHQLGGVSLEYLDTTGLVLLLLCFCELICGFLVASIADFPWNVFLCPSIIAP